MPAACERNAHAADLAGICEATSTRPQAFPREKGWVNGKDRQICHCEPVTDVTGAAIRFPFAMPCITPCLWGRGFPRRCAHRLGMTGAVVGVTVCVSVVRPCGSMWASTPTKRSPIHFRQPRGRGRAPPLRNSPSQKPESGQSKTDIQSGCPLGLVISQCC